MEPFLCLVVLALLAAAATAGTFRPLQPTVIVVNPAEGHTSDPFGCLTVVVLIILALIILSMISGGVQ